MFETLFPILTYFTNILGYFEGKMMKFKVAHFPHGIISQSQKTNTGKEQSLEEASLGWSSGPE